MTELIQKLLDKKASENNTIDLDAYTHGLENMFAALQPKWIKINSEEDLLKILSEVGSSEKVKLLSSKVKESNKKLEANRIEIRSLMTKNNLPTKKYGKYSVIQDKNYEGKTIYITVLNYR